MSFGNLDKIVYVIPSVLSLLILVIFYGFWRRRMVKMIFRGRYDRVKPAYLFSREIIIVFAILLFGFVMLKPQWGVKYRDVKKEGSDLLVAIDVSPSMLAKDVKPSRLEKAKEAVRLLSESLNGDRIGLVLFSGNAFLQCPLTTDMGAFSMFLDGADVSSVQLQGTDIGKALNVSAEVFNRKKITNKMLLLITDGEDHEENVDKTVSLLKENGVKVYAAMIGKPGGDLIELPKDDPSGEVYLRDSEGKLVRAGVDTDLLKEVSEETGGFFFDLSEGFAGIKKVADVVKNNQKTDFGSSLISEPVDRFQIFAAVLVLLLLSELFVGKRSIGLNMKQAPSKE